MNTALSFEEKILALSTIRTLGLRKAVAILSIHKRCSSPAMREELDKMDAKHYLLDEGIVEKTDTGIVRYVSFAYPQQPNVLTQEYYERQKPAMQVRIVEALASLNCSHLLRPLRTVPHKKAA